jgi:pyruvate,water dikinase
MGNRVSPTHNYDITIKGKVIVVTDPSKICQILSNDIDLSSLSSKILVAKNTDPGYTLLLNIVKCVIVEQGGDLSHAAIVTREIQKPCIIGIPNITNYLNDDDEIEVDIKLGKITF